MGKLYGSDANIPELRMPSYEDLSSERTSDTDLLDVSVMINELQKLPKGSKLCITQDGNYAVGDLAYIYNKPQRVCEDKDIFIIGHSEQSV